MGLVDGQRDRHDRDHVPRVAEGEEGQNRAEPRLGGRGSEVGLQHLEPADDLQQQTRDEQVGERQRGQGHEVVGQRQVSCVAAAEREGVAGGHRRERIGRRLEGGVSPRAAHDPGQQRSRAGDERAAPRAQHDHGRQVDARGDAEDSRAEGLTDAGALRLLEQLGGERGRAEQRQRGQRAAGSSDRSGHGDAETGRDGRVSEDG